MASSRSNPTGAWLVLGIATLIAAVAVGAWLLKGTGSSDASGFAAAMTSGKSHYDSGSFSKALDAFQSALALNPNNPDVHLNLANTQLRLKQPALAVQHAARALEFEPGSAAAHYVTGCAELRLGNVTNAIQSLQQAKDIDRRVNAVSYQLGLAFVRLGQFPAALEQFEEVTQFETNHASAYYQLSQMQRRLGQEEAAAASLVMHQQITAGKTVPADDPAVFEKCEHTDIRAVFVLEQPEAMGIPIKFVDATSTAFGGDASGLSGPFGVIDIARRGTNDLFLIEKAAGLRMMRNVNGVFKPQGGVFPLAAAETLFEIRAAELNTISDLQPERQEDLVVAGSAGVRFFRVMTNGTITEVTRFSGVGAAAAASLQLADLDFTGKLGMVVAGTNGQLRTYRSLGNLLFRDVSATSGIPVEVRGVSQVLVDDLNNDDLPDVLVFRSGQRPMTVLNQRGGGGLKESPLIGEWPESPGGTTADLNNDLRTDIAFLTPDAISISFGGLREPSRIPAKRHQCQQIEAVDIDNDGWMDLVGWGSEGVRVWRNRGRLGFHETTDEFGLGQLRGRRVNHAAWADLDADCDTDLVVDVDGQGTRLLRNDGGNSNGQLKLRFLGTRSNPSGIGVKAEIFAGAFHVVRAAGRTPLEIGLGKHRAIDVVNVRWFDTQQPLSFDTAPSCRPIDLIELTTPTGSCPYLYAWDGSRNRFVTDMLGASPLGLPAMRGRLIEADPEELLAIGSEADLVPRNGMYELRITEELREVLYLDSARLVVVDRLPVEEIHPTSKLMPGPPFPSHGLRRVSGAVELKHAEDLEGRDVTGILKHLDGVRVSPANLRGPGLRGLAESHGVVLDFGPLDETGHWVMALTGWLRFGGGMANVGASDNDSLPFPFPVLSAETASGQWVRLDLQPGAPAGKTKTILVDLKGMIPPGARRLKLEAGFEIHWDRIALFSNASEARSEAEVVPSATDLHWRGYSRFADLPESAPLTPVYEDVKARPDWRITPSGWATRYGDVRELVVARDDALVLVAGGDELLLRFDAATLPAKKPGMIREYFLRVVGWDKDADFHVVRGWTIDPLPWSGMRSSTYGEEQRPIIPADALHGKYNHRWIGPMVWDRKSQRSATR